jgi:YHS domain-containing protein
MFRLIFYLLCTVFLITFVRGVIGVVMKGLSALLNPAQAPPRRPAGASVPLTGELKRDPVCGTYIATSTSLKHGDGPETVYFCSAACRDKFLVSAAGKRGTA